MFVACTRRPPINSLSPHISTSYSFFALRSYFVIFCTAPFSVQHTRRRPLVPADVGNYLRTVLCDLIRSKLLVFAHYALRCFVFRCRFCTMYSLLNCTHRRPSSQLVSVFIYRSCAPTRVSTAALYWYYVLVAFSDPRRPFAHAFVVRSYLHCHGASSR